MNKDAVTYTTATSDLASGRYYYLLQSFFSGLLIPLGFAPFHFPGLTILGIALFYASITKQRLKQSLLRGFIFGLGCFSLGISWIYNSIHEYGHLNAALSAFVTLLFVIYLALYPAFVALFYTRLSNRRSLLASGLIFSSLWCLSEYLRSTLMSGFPWLLLGFGQIDTPLRYLLPIIGIYGVGFLTCWAATFLTMITHPAQTKRYLGISLFICILLAPSLLKFVTWTVVQPTPLSVGVIQANLSMRDKWDESLFWKMMQQYKESFDRLVQKNQLIVMPESAVPIPENYISDYIDSFNQQAKLANSAVLLGIPQATSVEETHYFNTLLSLGHAEGHYIKQHLVPFGEFIPQPFEKIIRFFDIPSANLKPGRRHQSLVKVHQHPIATLICYELAYPELLRKQLPEAEWIVSISDDGWFGHSLAMYQQLQMAQVLSLQTGRYQVVSNNDGLSSIIDNNGNLTDSLPAFKSGLLESTVYSATGATPWVYLGDYPVLILSFLLFLLAMWRAFQKSPYTS